MTSLVKALSSAAANRSSLLVTGLVLLLVTGLFFIPELVDFQRTLGGAGAKRAVPSAETEVVSSAERAVAPDRVVAPKESSLAQLASLIEGGYLEQLRAEANSRRAQQSGSRTGLPMPPGVSDAEIRAAQVFGRRPLSWNDIKEPDASSYLNNARGKTIELYRLVSDATPESKVALLNFLSGLQMVLQGGDGMMTVEQGLKWLEGLDNTVTKAMVREGIERATFMQWRQVSIALALQGSRAVRLKQQYYVPFNPRLTLAVVQMSKAGDGAGRYIDDDSPVRLDFGGYVVGRDIEKVELFIDGQNAGPMQLSEPDSRGRRYFSWLLGNARQLHTIRVVDTYGESFERHYSFYPRVRRFAWNKDGRWLIPVARTLEDTSIDRIFRSHAGSSQGSSNRIYEVF